MKSTIVKHREAVARQAAHDKLSLGQKIAKAKTRRGESKREITRLEILQKKVDAKAKA